MKEYEVNIIETASRVFTITASSPEMARQIIIDRYYNDEIVLDYSDYDFADFVVIGKD